MTSKQVVTLDIEAPTIGLQMVVLSEGHQKNSKQNNIKNLYLRRKYI